MSSVATASLLLLDGGALGGIGKAGDGVSDVFQRINEIVEGVRAGADQDAGHDRVEPSPLSWEVVEQPDGGGDNADQQADDEAAGEGDRRLGRYIERTFSKVIYPTLGML